MSELPTVDGREVIRALERVEFRVDRIKGSHHVMKKAGHRHVVTVPVHGRKSLKAGTLKGIIKSAGLTLEEFIEALGK